MLRLSSRPCPLGRRAVSAFPASVSVSVRVEPGRACATTATQTHGHRTLPPSTRSTGLAGQAGGDLRVCVCTVGMCVERRESTCVREARYLTVRLAGWLV